MKKQWNVKYDARRDDITNLPVFIDTILDNRGVLYEDNFLHPTEDSLIDFEEMYGVGSAANVVLDAINYGKNIYIFADVDLDGIASAAIMARYLWNFTNNIVVGINQGKAHGLSSFDIAKLKGIDLMIIVDSMSFKEDYQKILDMGISIVNLDHHKISDDIMSMRDDIHLVSSQYDEYENKALSGAGVCWKFCKYMDEMQWTDYADALVDLATCGIIADMSSVGLDSMENRYICSLGFNNQTNLAVKKINGTYAFNAQAVSFGIAPLVNSANRLGNNEMALQLFLSDDEREVKEIIKELKSDKEWQNADIARMLPSIMKQFESQKDNKCLYFFIDSDTEVAGLIGNKLLEMYQRPLFVLKNTDGADFAGSMRAVGLDDFAKIVNDTGIGRCMGHELAAGAFIPKDRFDEFRRKIEEALASIEFKQTIDIDLLLDERQINDELIRQIKVLNKISGSGFRPVNVMIDGITDYRIESMSKGKHLKIVTPNMILIKWNFNGWDDISEGMTLKAYGQLDCGFFGRTFYRQLIMTDFELT